MSVKNNFDQLHVWRRQTVRLSVRSGCTVIVGLVLLAISACIPQDDVYPPPPQEVCIGDFSRIDTLPPGSIGCNAIDCCPECPVTGSYDLRISVSGELIDHVSIRIEEFTSDAANQQLAESASQENIPDYYEVQQGITTIPGIAEYPDVPPLEVFPTIHLIARDQIQQFFQRSPAQQHDSNENLSSEISVEIEHLVEDTVLKSIQAGYAIIPCGEFALVPDTDRISVSDNTGSDLAVVLSSGKRTSDGCIRNRSHRVSNFVNVGNYLAVDGTCNTELAVFSDDDAIKLLGNSSAAVWARWTNMPSDVQPASLLTGRWSLPIKVWIAVPDTPAGTRAATLSQAQTEILLADLYLNVNHAGISVNDAAIYTTLTDNAKITSITNIATSISNTGSFTISQINTIRNDASVFDSNALNVYYVDNAAISGLHLRDGFQNSHKLIFIGTGSTPESLTHEIAHALSLQHANTCQWVGGNCILVSEDFDTNSIPDFPTTNIMWGGGSGRSQFTEGQDFRMTFDTHSILNTQSIRTASPASRNCPENEISDSCPWIGLDIGPN